VYQSKQYQSLQQSIFISSSSFQYVDACTKLQTEDCSRLHFCTTLTNVLLSWLRSTEELQETGTVDVLFGTFWRLPFIYVAMFLARAASIAFFKPLFDCAGTGAVTAAVYVSCANLQGGIVPLATQFRRRSFVPCQTHIPWC
jgi:hypothetical protein